MAGREDRAPVPRRARPAGGLTARAGEAKRLAKFAQAIARIEFGRAYWDERLQREATRAASSAAQAKGRPIAGARDWFGEPEFGSVVFKPSAAWHTDCHPVDVGATPQCTLKP